MLHIETTVRQPLARQDDCSSHLRIRCWRRRGATGSLTPRPGRGDWYSCLGQCLEGPPKADLMSRHSSSPNTYVPVVSQTSLPHGVLGQGWPRGKSARNWASGSEALGTFTLQQPLEGPRPFWPGLWPPVAIPAPRPTMLTPSPTAEAEVTALGRRQG